jgi:hypothetical protein
MDVPKPELVRICHPSPDVDDAWVAPSAVAHWQRAGWTEAEDQTRPVAKPKPKNTRTEAPAPAVTPSSPADTDEGSARKPATRRTPKES